MKSARYYSLDVFRGATVALMILVNNPGTWSAIYPPLEHAKWHGCTPTDLVFPFFLFAVGNAMTFVMPKFRQQDSSVFWKKVIKRTLLIFAIGLFLNWCPFFKWDHNSLSFMSWKSSEESGVRIMGVLQRIAIAYFFASVIAYYFKEKMVLWISGALLVIYWLLTSLLGGTDPYSIEGFIGVPIDHSILGVAHEYKGEGVPFDPEGLFSTIPAIPQVLFGYLVGNYIQKKGNIQWFGKTLKENSIYSMLSGLFVLGIIALFISYVWQLDFPYNKKIWSSSYTLLTTGLAITVLGVLIWFIEILEIRNGLMKFFDVFGKNPLFIYVISGVVPRLFSLIRIENGLDDKGKIKYLSPLGWFHKHICDPISYSPEFGSFLYALIFLGFCWLLAYWLDKKKIYIKV
ncbi:acyltransferase family protein [Elizabethkingia occulta]|uniref:acyltransferase family protein n=1 Tax=Elizabethkingia occulta TaxID=1867263 RepID=UPI000998EBB4|nr:heparan-alpha-glucosaminide N-acetyltransferase domain-containing protein [Elizabethkingia occulta]OPB87711.1 DUF5009 domain-containing protein [Elizabethkingia occulta]